MAPMSQAEVCGAPTTPFALDLEQLSTQVRERTAVDTPALYKRIVEGGMLASVSRQYTTIIRFTQAISAPISTVM